MSRLRPYAPSPSLRRLAALSLVLLAVLALSLTGTGPAVAQGAYEPDPQVVADVWVYASETDKGFDHVLRWMRALKTFGAVDDMTAAEAQENAEQYWAARWDPVVAELTELENAPDDYEPDQELVDQVWVYAAETDNGFSHVLRWMRVLKALGAVADMSAAEAQGYADRGWPRWEPVAAELEKLEASTADPEPNTTPEPTATPPPNRAPVVNEQTEWYYQFVGNINAPRGILVSKPFHNVFTDPDGDELTYTAEITSGNGELVELLDVVIDADVRTEDHDHLEVGVLTRVWFRAESEADWKAITPLLPDRPVVTVTLTATDPEGLSISLSSDFITWWESYPEVVRAVASRQVIELTFDWAVESNPAPGPEQFTVNVANGDGSEGTVAVSGVSVNGKVVTLALASALEEGQTVTLDYTYNYHDDVALQRAGGGDAVPGFTGQVVDMSLLAPPGEPENFDVSAVPGTLNVLARWDALDGATSYKLRWRKPGGEFEAANAVSVSGDTAVITVSEAVEWEVWLQACNDAGCGPEASRSVDVTQELRLGLSQARDADGNTLPRTIAATWDPVPDAASYTLRWWPAGTNPPTPAQPNAARQPRAASGPSGAGDQGSNDPGENRLTVSGDRTGADFTVPNDGIYRAQLQANDEDDAVIAQDDAQVNQAPNQTDTTPPRMVRGEIDGSIMTIYFSEPLDENPVRGYFYMAVQTGRCICWAGGYQDVPIEISGNKVKVDFKGSVQANPGLWASVSYAVRPGDSGNLRDLAGNRVRTHKTWYSGTRTTRPVYLNNLTGRPFVNGVSVSSDAGADRTYVDGDTIRVKLAFSEAVDVTGTPRVKMDLDPAAGDEQWADYSGGTGTKALEFSYTVVEGDHSINGVAVLQNTLELNGGTIRSASAGGVENAKLAHGGLDHDPKHRVVTPATAAPTLFLATVEGATLTLTFSEPLGAAASLANSAFTVKKTPQSGAEQTVSLSGTPAIDGATVTLTLASAVLDTDAGVMASYEKPASGTNNKLVDAAGNEAASFTDEPVTNTADTTPPKLERVELDGDTVTLYFSEPLDETTGGAGDDYEINMQWTANVDDAPDYGRCRVGFGWADFTLEPREVHVSGNTVVVVGLDESEKTRSGVGQRTNAFHYVADLTAPADQRLRDLSGNHVHTPNYFDGKWRTDLVEALGVTELPSPERAWVDGNRLTLTFDAPMDGGSKPAASAFTVKVNSNAVSLSSANPVTVSGREVTLTLAAHVGQGDNVTVSYTKPSNRPLQNVICEDAPGFSDEPVTNVTGVWPSISGVAITSDPGDDNTYGLGDIIRVAVTFRMPVAVDTTAGAPRLKIDLDPTDGRAQWANYETGSGMNTLTFAYTVLKPDTSRRGIAVLENSLELNGGRIRSVADQTIDALLSHPGLDHDGSHKVDGVAPSLQVVAVGPTTVSLTFSKVLDAHSVPPASAFTVKKTPQGGAEETVSLSGSPAIAGAVVILPLANPLLSSDTDVKVSYDQSAPDDDHKLRYRGGNPVASFTDRTDTTPPRLVRGEIDGGHIALYFSEEMDEDSVGGNFRVTLLRTSHRFGGGATINATGEVEINGSKVLVGLGEGKTHEAGKFAQALYVKFHDPSIPRLRDFAGNEVWTPERRGNGRSGTRVIDLESVPSPKPSNTAPSLRVVAVGRTTVSLTFSETLDAYSVPPASAFTVKKTPQGGAEETVSLSGTPAIAGATVILPLANPVLSSDTDVKVSYDQSAPDADHKLKDRDGNLAPSYNDRTDTTLPQLVRGEIDGDQMTLYFSEELDEDATGGFFSVTLETLRGGWKVFIANGEVEVNGSKVLVGLGEGRKHQPGENAWVHFIKYGDPTTPPFQDLADNKVPATEDGIYVELDTLTE